MMQARVAGGDSADGHVTVLKSKYIDKASPMLAKGEGALSRTPMMMQASTRGERSGDPSAVIGGRYKATSKHPPLTAT